MEYGSNEQTRNGRDGPLIPKRGSPTVLVHMYVQNAVGKCCIYFSRKVIVILKLFQVSNILLEAESKDVFTEKCVL